MALLAKATCAQEEEIWEFSPYRVQVWVALEQTPELTSRLSDQIIRTIEWQADVADIAVWRVDAELAPAEYRSEIVYGLEQMTIADETDEADPRLQGDKSIFVSVSLTPGGYRIQARQLDCRYRQWSPVIERTTLQIDRIPFEAAVAMRQSFRPIVQIEKVQGKEAQVRVRAGGLVLTESSPGWIGDDAILHPVIRRNDRVGKIKEGGMQPLPWTLLTIERRERQSTLYCDTHSAMRYPLAGRTSMRVQRVAIVVRPTAEFSVLNTISQGKKSSKPLSGYEVYSRTPDSEESELLGLTDWRGSIVVPKHETSPLRTLYVKSGARLLARLPMVPGAENGLLAELPDDDHRLGAEAVVNGLENLFLDLIARQQVLASEIREAIQEKDLDEADKKLAELRKVEDRSKFTMRLDLQHQALKKRNPVDGDKVDRLFLDLRNILGSHLNPNLPSELKREIEAARGGARPPTS